MRKVFIVLVFTLLATTAAGQCRMAAAGACHVIPVAKSPLPVAIGEVIERGRYSMVMDATWYGLPPARDGWIYFRIEDEVYRVDYRTMTVVERATEEASRNWP
ncbi:hypothetical protein ACOI1H_10850 [Loktanella sp. DJP18]|uniref:hypothetical protein n=1 Tax=Loktanella sp. DJP18 TaxID=3409788 RepID=UPI003BB7F59C